MKKIVEPTDFSANSKIGIGIAIHPASEARILRKQEVYKLIHRLNAMIIDELFLKPRAFSGDSIIGSQESSKNKITTLKLLK